MYHSLPGAHAGRVPSRSGEDAEVPGVLNDAFGAVAGPMAVRVPFRQFLGDCRTADGVRIAHAVSGRGPVLLKASNGLSHLEFDAGSDSWGHLLAELSSDRSLVRHDRRGCGLSDRDVADVSLDGWVADLEAVVAARGLERFPLLGVSDGALVALAYAARHPHRVSRLILHGAWARPGGRVACHGGMDLRDVAASEALYGRMREVEDRVDLAPMLGRITCPTLLLHASGDPDVPIAQARWLARQLRDAQVIPLDSASHLLQPSERAWGRWLSEVRRFLPGEPEASSPIAELTVRELDVLDLVAQGRDNPTIAATLGLGTKTVRNHVSALYRKLGTSSRGQAVACAREAGFGQTFRPGPDSA